MKNDPNRSGVQKRTPGRFYLLHSVGVFWYTDKNRGGGEKMTAARKRALANAVASARMEGLEISEQEKRDCLRYLDGKIDTATLVREALKRQKKQELFRR